MAKYKILKEFYDLEKKKLHSAGNEVDFTVKRAEAIEKILQNKGYEGKFIERIVKVTEEKEDVDY